MLKVVIGAIALAGAYIIFRKKRRSRLHSERKCVFITGCDSGVGLALALRTSSLGFHVVASCLDELSDGAKMLKEYKINVIQMDVTKSNDVQGAKEAVEKYLEETNSYLWAIINNAGVLIYGNFEWQVESQILQQINVNLLGVFHVTKAFLPFLRMSKGRIINITSANGHWCLPGLSVYCASKHAIEGFSHSLRMEMIPWNVKVILINPGNLPKSTKILSLQSKHASVMKESFQPADWEIYGDYFNCFQEHLQENFSSLQETRPLVDPGLDSALESSLSDENPKYYYNNISTGFKIFIFISQCLPVYLADSLMLQFWGKAIGWNWNAMKRFNSTA